MRKFIQLQVSACSEDISGMNNHPCGKFCNSCNKTVVDFSTMTDNQLAGFFKTQPTGICGMFHPEQLNRPLELPVKKISMLKYFFNIALPAFLLSAKADAQKIVKQNQHTLFQKPGLKKITIPAATTISSVIQDEEGKPVPFATIMEKGSSNGTAADEKGNFTLVVSAFNAELIISSVGFETKECTVADCVKPIPLKIAMSAPVIVSAGDKYSCRMVAGGISSKIVTINTFSSEQKAASPSPVAACTIFPNPAGKNEMITIRFKEPLNKDYLVSVFSTNGMLVQQQQYSKIKNLNELQFQLHVSAAGMYRIEITDLSANKKTGQLILVH
ncbi:MAG: carboxypeptidase-like regulatory domain-containing protein [Bacteroidetes bacterium]|nr:carboxypeptidase-like regulatory domain-containing protein [Bacteroidota bacterium]